MGNLFDFKICHRRPFCIFAKITFDRIYKMAISDWSAILDARKCTFDRISGHFRAIQILFL